MTTALALLLHRLRRRLTRRPACGPVSDPTNVQMRVVEDE